MRIAIIGAGGMALSHVKAYQEIDGFEVAALCDIDEKKAAYMAEKLHCPYYTDMEKMLEECCLDAVDICVPSYLHYKIIMKCFHNNLHVFCEKPIAYSSEDAKKILEEKEKTGKVLMVGHVVRYWPEYQYLKRSIENEAYGSLQYLFMQRTFGTHEKGSWYMDPEKCKMACYEMHIHDTDFINSVYGIPVCVDSVGVERPEIHFSYISTRYHYGKGSPVIIAEGGWNDSTVEFSAGFRAVFEHGVLEYKDGKLREFLSGEEKREGGVIPVDGPSDIVGVVRELKEFLALVSGENITPLSSAESAADTLLILEKEQESMESGQKIVIGK